MAREENVGAEREPVEVKPGEEAMAAADAEIAADGRLAALEPPRPLGRRLHALMPLAFLSAIVHLMIFATLLFLSKAPAPAAEPQETAVEVVREPPIDKKPEEAKTSADKADTTRKAEGASPERDAKREEAQRPVDEQKPQPAKPESAEPEQPKQEQAKQEEAKPEQPESLKPAEPPRTPSAEELASLQALQSELATLKAQQADLETQSQAQAEEGARAASQAAAADRTKALGLLPESFSAVTMPSLSPTGEDPITYQQAVYNLISRAKRSGQAYMAGVAHVVFDIDDKGDLTRVAVDHSSGNAAVDREAVALIRRAAPFPPPPVGAPRSFPAYMSFVADH